MRLGLAHPNTFGTGERTSIELVLPSAGTVVATVHDVTGRRVAQLVDERLRAGQHRLVWNGRTASGGSATAGVYFLRVHTEDGTRSRKMLRVR